jgi:putative phosphoribosyl transferase
VFRDREEAGDRLATALRAYSRPKPLILAIPRGGIPVGYRVAVRLEAEFDLVVARKVPIPWEPEAGLGAVGPDGDLALNEDLVAHLGLASEDVSALSREALREVRRRETLLRGNRRPPVVRGRTVILVDDGLATGYTMIAAAKWVRGAGPNRLVIAVPCSSEAALETVTPLADAVAVLEVGRGPFFAVASFYRTWRDLTDDDVLPYLRRAWKRDIIVEDNNAKNYRMTGGHPKRELD